MEIIQAIILGIVQGASEFLPISSSGHLYLIPKILGWGGVVNSLSFDVALHLGTTFAVIVFFWRDWVEIIGSFLKTLPKGFSEVWKDEKARLFVFLVIASIPAGVFGLIFNNFFETSARNVPLVATALIFFAILLFLGDHIGRKTRAMRDLNLMDVISIGLAQVLALVPGVSRSGVTITSALFRDLKREDAAKFTFLLSTPVILGASLMKVKDLVHGSLSSSEQGIFLSGILAAALSGFLAIKILLKFVQTNSFNTFVVYRILLGVAILAAFIGI